MKFWKIAAAAAVGTLAVLGGRAVVRSLRETAQAYAAAELRARAVASMAAATRQVTARDRAR